MPANVLSRCSGSFAACRSGAESGAASEAEVEPWGVHDVESWSERRQADSGNEIQASTTEGSRRPDAAASGSEIKCPECNATHSESMRAMSQLLPGVGLLSAAESDGVRRQMCSCALHHLGPCPAACCGTSPARLHCSTCAM